MIQKLNRIITISAILILCLTLTVTAQKTRARKFQNWCDPQIGLNGLYRVDFDRSDALYSVIEGASSSVPFGCEREVCNGKPRYLSW